MREAAGGPVVLPGVEVSASQREILTEGERLRLARQPLRRAGRLTLESRQLFGGAPALLPEAPEGRPPGGLLEPAVHRPARLGDPRPPSAAFVGAPPRQMASQLAGPGSRDATPRFP